MRHLYAVIGANYGDEGKGRCVDYLVRKSQERQRAIVVRHNSGGQAGHTVQYGNYRHVHSHTGSGTLYGNGITFLLHKFVCNPMIFNDEYDEIIRDTAWTPEVHVSGSCLVSTPLDAFINQCREVARGEGRHGSCGVGFGETLARAEAVPRLNITASMTENNVITLKTLLCNYTFDKIVDEDIVPYSNEKMMKIFNDLKDGAFNWMAYVKHFELFKSRIQVQSEEFMADVIRGTGRDVIFEGAQGLLLHQDSKNFPHVTRSRTGVQDICEFLDKYKINAAVTPYYCTRAYLTRHGAGPLENECTPELMAEIGYRIDDPTNKPNPHQGSLRFSPVISTLSHIWDDWQSESGRVNRPYVMISCCDQVPIPEVNKVAARVQSWAQAVYLGFGPRSADTELLSKWRANMGSPATETVTDPKEPEVDAAEQQKTADEEGTAGAETSEA